MSKTALNLFPARAPIGRATLPNGQVIDVPASPEFSRALANLFERVGGAVNMGVDDLALVASTVTQPDQVARREAADALAAPAIDQSALVAALVRKIAVLQTQVTQVEGVRAELAKLARRIDAAEQIATFRDPCRVNWERPGRLGFFKANTGAFTTLTATSVTATGGFGCNGKAAQTAYALGAAATDLASAITLANNLRAMAIANGIGA